MKTLELIKGIKMMVRDDSTQGVSVFEEKHMISVLIYLAANGPSRKIDIYDGVSSNPRMPDKLNNLERYGLVTQEMDTGTRSTIVTLTPKGEDVAAKFSEIDEMMKD